MNIFEKPDIMLIIKTILVFYILLGSSTIQPLLAKQWKRTLENNRFMQHIVGVSIIIGILLIINNGSIDNNKIIIYSVISYILFIITTKMDIHWNIILLILILIIYAYYLHINKLNNHITNDTNISEEEKNHLINKNYTKIAYIIVIAIIVMLCGNFLYSTKKEIQYGVSYNIIDFFIK